MPSIWEFWIKKSDDILEMLIGHLGVVLVSLLAATLIAVLVGIISVRTNLVAGISLATSSIFLTIPSLALLAFMIPLFGLGWLPTVIALTLYSLLPILRNTIVGLRAVPAAITESARGMGMSRMRTLFKIELPLAAPLILSGIRVSAQLIVGVAAIAAYVAGPGFGAYIFKGLSSLGSANAINFALTGTLGVLLIALLIDGIFALVLKYGLARSMNV